MKHHEFLSRIEDDKIVSAIAAAENKTSGEIRVFISREQPASEAATMQLAQAAFEKLGMTATKLRNGVLIFFAPVAQKFAVIGDSGIHERCGQDFWHQVSSRIGARLREGKFTEAVVAGIEDAGNALAQHFPRAPDDRNELPNRVETD